MRGGCKKNVDALDQLEQQLPPFLIFEVDANTLLSSIVLFHSQVGGFGLPSIDDFRCGRNRSALIQF